MIIESQKEKSFKVNTTKALLIRLLRQIKKEFQLLWTDKFNIFIALVVPPLVVALLGITGTGSTGPSAINCVVISYDSNSFFNELNFTESRLDDYHSKYVDAVNESALLNLVQFFNAIEDIYEPYLIQIGFLDRTPRGRVATRKAFEHFQISLPSNQKNLF